MQLRRYKDILALKTERGSLLGFHPRNIEIAELDELVWDQMIPVEIASSEFANPTAAFADLEEWNADSDPETQDLLQAKSVRYYSVNIAQICNLKCTYCAADGDGTYGSKTQKVDTSRVENQLRSILNSLLKETDTKSSEQIPFEIRFLGGEPLLYPQLISEISNFARLQTAGSRIQLLFSITTNGTLITPSTAELLAQLHAEVTVSLDGDRTANDRVRPAKGRRSSTEMTLAGIENLKRVRPLLRGLKVNSVFGAHNMNVYDTYRYLTSLEVDWDSINLNYANNENFENSKLYVAELEKVAEAAFKSEGLLGLTRITQFRSTLARLESKTRIHSYCGAGQSLVQADTKTDLFTCNWLMSDSSEKVQLSQWPARQATLIEMNNCGSCWARHLCGGGCMAVHKAKTGSKHSKDPAFCFRQRSLAALAIIYYYESLTNQNKTATSVA